MGSARGYAWFTGGQKNKSFQSYLTFLCFTGIWFEMNDPIYSITLDQLQYIERSNWEAKLLHRKSSTHPPIQLSCNIPKRLTVADFSAVFFIFSTFDICHLANSNIKACKWMSFSPQPLKSSSPLMILMRSCGVGVT